VILLPQYSLGCNILIWLFGDSLLDSGWADTGIRPYKGLNTVLDLNAKPLCACRRALCYDRRNEARVKAACGGRE
jgi:hypothetical protein